MRGSHKMVTDKVLVAIKGNESKEGRKNRGRGEGKDIVVIKRFSITTRVWQLKNFQLPRDLWWPKTFQSPSDYGNQKPFGSHMRMATKKISFTIVACLLNLIVIQWHWINLIAIRQRLCISIVANGFVGIFGCHLGTIR